MRRTHARWAAAALIAAGFGLLGCKQSPILDDPPAEVSDRLEPQAATPTEPAPASIPQATEPADEQPRWVELSPGLRIDRERRIVEFDGFVPWQFKDPAQPVTYLETIVCKTDSKEHESLVATAVRPSAIHGALLAIGMEPGRPGRIGFTPEGEFVRDGPSGPRVHVRIVTTWPDGEEREINPLDWVVNVEDGTPLREHYAGLGETVAWRFTGSVERDRGGRRVYEADVEGVIIALHTFGSAVVGFEPVLSPDSGVDEPEWIADVEAVPEFGEQVRVRVWVAD